MRLDSNLTGFKFNGIYYILEAGFDLPDPEIPESPSGASGVTKKKKKKKQESYKTETKKDETNAKTKTRPNAKTKTTTKDRYQDKTTTTTKTYTKTHGREAKNRIYAQYSKRTHTHKMCTCATVVSGPHDVMSNVLPLDRTRSFHIDMDAIP